MSEGSCLVIRGEARKGYGETFDNQELERSVYFGEFPQSARVPDIELESIEDLDSQTMDCLAMVGPHIYTDISRIEGKVGAALMGWRDKEETWHLALSPDPFCTVFQAVTIALQRTRRRKTYHPLTDEARHDISEIVAESRAVRLWVRAHAGITDKERAYECTRRATRTKKMAAGFDRLLLSQANEVIRAASLKE
ncbi:hypothetical protein EVAR_34670_1 [Eumeta japonica]|uniref:RNase H type-1 domain-containing protein n=1 Tax=Eumeta variegata TaxID=151549 RepID=A0A4C1VG88_EUMVA|nr:hypothetical protein EVAR_34670_1 [Eumeta japonica]